MIINIEPKHYNVLVAVAPKNESRYSLNGFFLDIKDKRAVVTDGHILVTVPITVLENDEPEGWEKGYLYHFPLKQKPLLKSTSEMTFHYVGTDITAEMHMLNNTGFYKAALEPIADGKFPKWQTVHIGAERKLDAQSLERVCFQPQLLANIVKAIEVYGEKHVMSPMTEVTFSEGHCWQVTFPADKDIECTFMAARVS